MQSPQGTAAEAAEVPADPATGRSFELTRTHRTLIGIVIAGAVVIAGIGFAGSYAAVRELALSKGFGWFANVFPIGIDAGIVVLLALDLLLTWLRIPFPLLRQTAWLLTVATIAFNGAASWPDPLGVGMHATIPVLFVVAVEAARHAIGRVADITADRHMESVRITRWLLAPFPTFRLWRRMKLWELRSYDEVIKLEQARLIYRARLRARYGRGWRRKAPVELIMPLRLARFGIPLDGEQLAAVSTAAPENRSIHPGPVSPRALDTATPGTGHADGSAHALPAERQVSPPDVSASVDPLATADDGESPQDGTASRLPSPVDTYKSPGVAEREPVMADRARRPAHTIHVRVPAQHRGEDQDTVPAGEDQEPEADDLASMPGIDAVRTAYERLSPEERSQSDRQKATKIADMTGLAYNTVRRYLSNLRKAQRDAVSDQDPEVSTQVDGDPADAATSIH